MDGYPGPYPGGYPANTGPGMMPGGEYPGHHPAYPDAMHHPANHSEGAMDPFSDDMQVWFVNEGTECEWLKWTVLNFKWVMWLI